MLFWTHLIVGVFAGLVYSFFDSSLVAFGVLIFSSLIPDIDSPTSRFGRRGISKVLMAFFKHRGVVHSFTFMFLISFFLFKFFDGVVLPFLIGYSTHLLLDCFTRKGVRLFWPLKKRFKGFSKSGGMFEAFVFVVFLLGSAFLFVFKVL